MTGFANPGPRWGYRTIAFFERLLPSPLFNSLLGTGTFIGLVAMKKRRRHSADYWRALTGRNPSISQQYRHFRAFMDNLVLKLQSGRGKYPEFHFSKDAHKESFLALCRSPGPALFGTFHVGYSDMLGCMLKIYGRQVSMVRVRVGNSFDTDVIERAFAGTVRFLWINDPADFIFRLKDAIQEGQSIAIQCDRSEFGSKTGIFRFLGAEREFPMTIYHLSDMFKIPAVIAFTGPRKREGHIDAYTSPVFRPRASRRETLEAARCHFQDVLDRLEVHLREHPELWFNFQQLGNEAEA